MQRSQFILLQAGRSCRMNGCSAFSRIVWTYAKYTQSLKCLPTQQQWFYSFNVKSICAVTDCSNRTVITGCHVDRVRASRNHVRHTQRYCSNKVDDEVAKESEPGLLRRFHQTYKEHGKILVGVHLVTSAVWAGIFYCAAVRYIVLQLFYINYTVYKSTYLLVSETVGE